MFDGSDTALYLHQGHSVVAIEANPQLAEQGRTRFRKEIEDGRLEILNVAISDEPSVTTFWICDSVLEWSSFDKQIASRDGSLCHSVEVETVRFREILERYPTPVYVKIDIEGADQACLSNLASPPPQYISIEAECFVDGSSPDRDAYLHQLRLLQQCGYSKFKLISQLGFCHLTGRFNFAKRCNSLMRLIREKSDVSYRAMQATGLYRLLNVTGSLERRVGHPLPFGSSGPWGEDTSGPWLDFDKAERVYELSRKSHFSRARFSAFSFWCDWHAKL